MFNIDLYKLPNGKIPIKEFFDTLNSYEMDEVDTILSLLEEHGNRLKMPHSRFLRDGVYELRIPTDEKNIRILYFFMAGKIIILTNAFCKKTARNAAKHNRISD